MSFREKKYEKWVKDQNECKKDFDEFSNKGRISKIIETDIWVERHLEKANHNMDFATLIADIHKTIIKERFSDKTFYDWTTIAFYYAIYHAALALLAKTGFKSKSHMATLCGIIYHFYHQNKLLEKKHIEILKQIEKENIEQFIEAQGLRERASYGVSISFEERLSELAKNDAIEFINKAKDILERFEQ